jgi:heat shock protein HtpX
MWEAIESNRRRTRVLVSGMAVLLVLLGTVIGYSVARGEGAALGAVAALGLWIILWLVAAFAGDRIMLSIAGARKIEHADAPQLFNVVEEMVIASQLGKMPEIYIIDDERPNAFAAGRKPEKRVVAVTSGLLRLMSRDELQGVIAHEIGHHKNGDPALMILMGVMLGAIVLLAEIFLRSGLHRGRRSSSKDQAGIQVLIIVLAIVLAILAPILARLLYFACSRRRVYLADASAARFTRYPEGLAAALEKITVHYQGAPKPNKVLAPMYIVNPMEALAAVGLFSTHPPTENRVRILRSMGGGVGYVDYDSAFKKVTGKAGCIGRRTLAADSPAEARAASPAPPETKEDAVQRLRDVGNLLGRLDGLTILTCACGVGIKLPPGASWPSIPCPRCGRDNPVPKAQPAAAPDEPLVFKKTGKGWESFQCTCGATINLSPLFQATTKQCGRCNRAIKIL